MDTKARIMKESLKLFLRKSFKDVTLSEILQKTHLSKGAFYYFFKSKEQLFLEIVETYFSYMVMYSFEEYSKNSLKEFYTDHLKDLGKAVSKFASVKAKIDTDNAISANYLYPIFDASRLFPEFREKLLDARKKEVFYWASAISRARNSGEIKSKMSDEQLARIFIYTGNSTGLQLIMENSPVSSVTGNYKEFWDNLYESLKP
jgi:TetR/AcrR family transcriptional regulator, transcriptional repressor for nem operon